MSERPDGVGRLAATFQRLQAMRRCALIPYITAGDPAAAPSVDNPVLRYGPQRFVRDARQSGAAGLLITDLPVGEDTELEAKLASGGLDLVRLLAPTTPETRAPLILDAAQGFIYYISRTGVTGEREQLRRGLAEEVEALRRRTDLPIGVGFGISNPDQGEAVAAVADGVVVGSALVRTLAGEGIDSAGRLARRLRNAIDAAT